MFGKLKSELTDASYGKSIDHSIRLSLVFYVQGRFDSHAISDLRAEINSSSGAMNQI